MLLGVEVNLFLFPEEIWRRAELQATEHAERHAQQEPGKRQIVTATANHIYARSLQSHFDAAMAGQFGGATWLSQREKHY